MWFPISDTPPFVPHLSSLDDTSNFDEFERVKYQPAFDEYNDTRDFSGKDLPFVGFTYVRNVKEEDSGYVRKVLHIYMPCY